MKLKVKNTVIKTAGACILSAALFTGQAFDVEAANAAMQEAMSNRPATVWATTISDYDNLISKVVDSTNTEDTVEEQVKEETKAQEVSINVGFEVLLGSGVERATISKNEVISVVSGYSNLGIANVDNHLNVREAPDENSKLVGKMPKNAGCEIIEDLGEWVKIKSGKVEGYAKAEFLFTGEAANAKAQEIMTTMATVVNTDSLRIRTEPSTDSATITLIPRGEKLEVLEDAGEFVKVGIDSDEGYISKEYVEISNELEKAVTLTEIKYGAGVSDVRVSIVEYAKTFLGNRYVYGGTSLTNGTDCSGFTMGIYRKFGISLPRTSGSQAGVGTKVSVADAKPGDLFFYGNGSRINHVAMYIGGGQVIHASTERTGIKISNATYRTPVAVKRIIND